MSSDDSDQSAQMCRVIWAHISDGRFSDVAAHFFVFLSCLFSYCLLCLAGSVWHDGHFVVQEGAVCFDFR